MVESSIDDFRLVFLHLYLTKIQINSLVKNPNWPEADQLAIYKRSREFELGATENNIS